MRKIFLIALSCLTVIQLSYHSVRGQAINRKALVQRHNIHLTSPDTLSALTIGNGKFAFTVDITGLQSFPGFYEKGIPLGTQSEWGWHSLPNTHHYQFESALKDYHLNGRDVSYAVQWNESGVHKEAADWFRQNPHRLQLGNIGFAIKNKDGAVVEIQDIKNIHHELDLWKGEIQSNFTIDGIPVDVITCSHPKEDAVAVRVKSPLVKLGRLSIFIRFPYPTGQWADVGNNWTNNEKHFSILKNGKSTATIERILDSSHYWVDLKWKGEVTLQEKMKNYFDLVPSTSSESFEVVFRFSPSIQNQLLTGFEESRTANALEWKKFWESGGAIDFSGSTDPRARELERRIVLSQYLLRVQEAGSYPPQETGLTYNSWFGKPHMEMHWWHAVHWALWGRIDLLEKSLSWYTKAFSNARAIAQRQGYEGARWQKMTDNEGNESPSSVGAFLIWQQPHFIYFAELCYREHKDKATLNKYKDLVFATADFMASFPFYEKESKRYILGKGVIPAQERFKPEQTFNPTFELAYWHVALSIAQEWRKRLGMPIEKKWEDVLNKLSPLPKQNNVYLATESAPDSYTLPANMTDHPSVLGAYGYLPKTRMVDSITMKNTFNLIWDSWNWKDTWGWDFPLTAMSAARLGLREKAIDALFMNIQTNTYLPNGHNYQDERLRIYMPGNGGLLTAVAMMCAGWDGCREKNPGIPKNKAWVVKWEGLRRMP